MRLDAYLQQRHPNVSRAYLQRLIKSGQVKVNGLRQTKNGAIIKQSDEIVLEQDFENRPALLATEIPVIYEDSECVIINKPVGILTHSKGAFNHEASVASWLSGRPDFSFEMEDCNERAGIVHRLDRATSGVMICAKNPTALRHLQKQFQDRKAKKTYVARIEGILAPVEAMVDLPIERNPKQPSRFRVGHNGKPAQTTYRSLQEIIGPSGKPDQLVELKPFTGRTHQLRVHLAYLKHPIVGDSFYGGRAAERMFLHAHCLEITLPNKKRDTFTAEIPKIFYTEADR
jgi:23S rRNA pseudouridine1911/1915/1917 synthase